MGEAGSRKPNGAVATRAVPSKLWRKYICKMEPTHTEKQGERAKAPDSKGSRSQEPGCTVSPGLGVPELPVSVQQTLLS